MICKYLAILDKGLEQPQILVATGHPGTSLSSPPIPSIWKEEIKLSSFVDDMENSKQFIAKLLETIWEFSKVTDYKIKIQK